MAPGRSRGLPRAEPGQHPRAPGPGGDRRAGRLGRAAGPVGGHGHRRPAYRAAGGRRAHPVAAAAAGSGGPAAAAGRGVPHPGRDRARRGGAGPARDGGGGEPGRGGRSRGGRVGGRAADRAGPGGGAAGGLRGGSERGPGGERVTAGAETPAGSAGAAGTDGAADVTIVGAGVVGTAIARELSQYRLRVVLVDAANDVGTGTTKANTAILHTGFDAEPGSLESRLLRRGSALLRDYADRAGIPVERTGALLVAWTAEQERELPSIADKARRNGYDAIRPVPAARLYELEPHLGPGARAGLEIPDESIVCPWTTPLAYATEAGRAGVRLLLDTRVTGLHTS